MFDVITKFLDSKIDYQTIFAFIGIYLLALWLMFCFLVFMDANKRYKKPLVAVLMALLVFVFNFPALIFYLIVRPEIDEFADLAAYDSMMQQSGGVQVPLVNFTGKNGEVTMSLNLSIHSQPASLADMVIDVGWDSANPNMKVSTAVSSPKTGTMPEKPQQENFRNRWDSIREKAKGQMKNINASVSSSVSASVDAASKDTDSDSDKADHNKHHKDKQSES